MQSLRTSRHLVITVATATFLGLLFEATAQADTYKEYDSGSATEYAEHNHDRAYGPNSNPFTDYDYISGGNCTNFVSQAVMAGFVGSKNATTVFDARYSYDIDASGSGYKWYFRSDGDRGPAFTGAHQLWQYAKNNQSSYKGLHFQYVTHDTPSEFMDYAAVLEGDVIFADWDNDGHFDHSMLVTDIQGWRFGYNEIRLTYQGTAGLGKTNIGLGDINEQYEYNAVFHVYRPVDYNPNGL